MGLIRGIAAGLIQRILFAIFAVLVFGAIIVLALVKLWAYESEKAQPKVDATTKELICRPWRAMWASGHMSGPNWDDFVYKAKVFGQPNEFGQSARLVATGHAYDPSASKYAVDLVAYECGSTRVSPVRPTGVDLVAAAALTAGALPASPTSADSPPDYTTIPPEVDHETFVESNRDVIQTLAGLQANLSNAQTVDDLRKACLEESAFDGSFVPSFKFSKSWLTDYSKRIQDGGYACAHNVAGTFGSAFNENWRIGQIALLNEVLGFVNGP